MVLMSIHIWVTHGMGIWQYHLMEMSEIWHIFWFLDGLSNGD